MNDLQVVEFEDAVDVFENGLISEISSESLQVEIIDIYNKISEEYKRIPWVSEVLEEIERYNFDIIETIAISLYRDGNEVSYIDKRNLTSTIYGVETKYDSLKSLEEDTISILVDIVYSASTVYTNPISETTVRRILDVNLYSYKLDFDDPIYKKYPLLADNYYSIIVNDAQMTLFDEFGWGYYKKAYEEYSGASGLSKNFMAIPGKPVKSSAIAFLSGGD